MKYRKKYGSLNAANRNEYMLAHLTYVLAKTSGIDDVDIYDFYPSRERPAVEVTDIFK